MVQIDMPMPKNCLDCPACNEYIMCAIPRAGAGWGENDVREFSQSRPEWCQMKEQEESIPISWLTEKLEGHPEIPYAVTDGITNVLYLWESR